MAGEVRQTGRVHRDGTKTVTQADDEQPATLCTKFRSLNSSLRELDDLKACEQESNVIESVSEKYT